MLQYLRPLSLEQCPDMSRQLPGSTLMKPLRERLSGSDADKFEQRSALRKQEHLIVTDEYP